ncbi:MAG: pyridoxal phosphate-dependent aminotransferase [Syntrophaceae bacterium]|nr:pyridoxal phosphate-dependent aminotransferase [Syntrophaceae bacterium]
MKYDFDTVRDRRGSDSAKWKKYGDDVLPLWVADMDFVSADPILQALHERVDHAFFGYSMPLGELCQTLLTRLKGLYGWDVRDEEIHNLPGLVTGLNFAVQAFTAPGDGVLIQPPVYPHFVKDPVHHGRVLVDPPLVEKGDTYEVDFEAFEKAITPRTRLFILCNPHNPVGRVFTRGELEKMAEICLRHRLVICADEIHCDLIFPGFRHIPIASLSPEVARWTITLLAPSKTYNLAGLRCGFAIIQNPDLAKRWKGATLGLNPGVNIMGQAAALAAYREGQEWLNQAIAYLVGNRDFLYRAVPERLPGVRMIKMEGTYLAWLDCRKAGIRVNPFQFFLKEAKVALNDGAEFGKGGEGFVRLNFACPRSMLNEALEKMSAALKLLP